MSDNKKEKNKQKKARDKPATDSNAAVSISTSYIERCNTSFNLQSIVWGK
jgi:hypothetical protein